MNRPLSPQAIEYLCGRQPSDDDESPFSVQLSPASLTAGNQRVLSNCVIRGLALITAIDIDIENRQFDSGDSAVLTLRALRAPVRTKGTVNRADKENIFRTRTNGATNANNVGIVFRPHRLQIAATTPVAPPPAMPPSVTYPGTPARVPMNIVAQDFELESIENLSAMDCYIQGLIRVHFEPITRETLDRLCQGGCK